MYLLDAINVNMIVDVRVNTPLGLRSADALSL
ncbi:MAG: hypothetical protein ACI808_001503 [Paraglaciecola sp.]|jgi:hypothetical protein